MEISVIVPVYNAASFVEQAVRSALDQTETCEVILVEDGSPDGSLQVCQRLAEKYEKVRLLQHPGGINKGAGASRNLGMRNAKCDYIAFLDADDFFLPGRFSETVKVFKDNPDCDGVYEAVGTHIQDEEARKRWIDSGEMKREFITMTRIIPPEELLERLLFMGAGYFHIIGLVFRRCLIDVIGFMDESLRLHQDTEYIYRLAAVGKLLPGNLSGPIALHRFHQNSRITAKRTNSQKYSDQQKMWISSYKWFLATGLSTESNMILRKLASHFMGNVSLSKRGSNKFIGKILKRLKLLGLIIEIPQVATKKQYWLLFLPGKTRIC